MDIRLRTQKANAASRINSGLMNLARCQQLLEQLGQKDQWQPVVDDVASQIIGFASMNGDEPVLKALVESIYKQGHYGEEG